MRYFHARGQQQIKKASLFYEVHRGLGQREEGGEELGGRAEGLEDVGLGHVVVGDHLVCTVQNMSAIPPAQSPQEKGDRVE